MQQNTPVNKWVSLCLFLTAAIYLFFIYHGLKLRDYDDDKIFLSIFNSEDMIKTLVYRYQTWSGRFVVEWVMTSTIGYAWFWKFGIPISITLACWSCRRIAGLKSSVASLSMTILLFSLIPYDINSDASWWVTGFYNYLLPIAICLYTFSIVYVESNSLLEKALCLTFSFYFSYMEQAGIAFVFSMAAIIFLRKKGRNSFNYLLILIVIINLIICLKAPGNERRFNEEIWKWYPQYQNYGLMNRLALGYDKLHQLMSMRYNLPLIIFSATLFYVRLIVGPMTNTFKIAMAILATFISISIAKCLTGIPNGGFFFNGIPVNAETWSEGKLYISYLYLLIVISSLFIIMLDMALQQLIPPTPVIAMLIGFMTVTMMGLSPTVYASGLRVDMFFEMMCILSTICIANIALK